MSVAYVGHSKKDKFKSRNINTCTFSKVMFTLQIEALPIKD
jgi:hypothetical protein